MTAQRVIKAAENLVRFLDGDSVADQEADFRVKLQRDLAERELTAAVGEFIAEVSAHWREGTK
jgi:hypothetical protein